MHFDNVIRFDNYYEVRRYGERQITQVIGQYNLIRYINNNYWHVLSPFSSKAVDKARGDIFSLKRDGYITNLHYGYDIWRIL